MSIPDELIAPYLHVYTLVPLDEVSRIEQGLRDGSVHPMQAKKQLAAAIVERYHGPQVAAAADTWFRDTFSQREVPADLPSVRVCGMPDVLRLLALCLPGKSRSDLRRLVQQNGVKLNDEKLSLMEAPHALRTGDVLKVGKRQWFRIVRVESLSPAD